MLTITGATTIMLDDTTERTGDLHVADGRITDGRISAGPISAGPVTDRPISAGPADGGQVLDATDCVITPGLVNAHHHLLQTAFRTLPGTRGVPMATWLPKMTEAYATIGVDAELCRAAALTGLAESLLCGVTTVADHHLTWPTGADTVAMAEATASAATELGARLVFVRGTAGDDPEQAAASVEAIAAALVPDGVDGISGDRMLQLATGPAGVHSDLPETFRLLGDVAARLGLRRRTQANEQVDVDAAVDRYGRRPLDLLDDWGWLAPDVTLAHLCGVTADEIARVAASGASATHAPGCDLPMGWGIAPVDALRRAGVTVGLGTSGGGSNDASHLLADARLAMQVAPLVGPALSARRVLGMATAGSAAGLGRGDLGHLRPGAAADLCVWDVGGVADAGVADPVAGLLWASPGRRPRHVVVAGRIVVRDGELVTADERRIARALRLLLARRIP